MTAMLERPRPRRIANPRPIRPAVVSITDPALTTDGYNLALAAYTRTAQPVAM